MLTVRGEIYKTYDGIIRTLVGMINHPETWLISPRNANQ